MDALATRPSIKGGARKKVRKGDENGDGFQAAFLAAELRQLAHSMDDS